MKRFIQFAAVVLMGLMAVQPAMAVLPCVEGEHAACVPGCPMTANGMSGDCHTNSMAATGNCRPESLPQVFAWIGTPKELHLSALASPVAAAFAIPAAELRFAVRLAIDARAASPPRYLLNQVFRI
jgi:hypothetical protein